MNWLTKILKKEGKTKVDKRTEKEIVSAQPRSIAAIEEPRGVIVKTGDARPAKKFLQNIILAYYLTEKTSPKKEDHKYVFKVFSVANKIGVRNAVEGRYGVKVKSVNIINTSSKERKKGGQVGFQSGFKKAIVTLEKGQSIEIV